MIYQKGKTNDLLTENKLKASLMNMHYIDNFLFLEYNVAVFVTNQMTADPGATMS